MRVLPRFVLMLLLLPAVASAEQDPTGDKFEAEDHKGSDSQIIDDADASGGKAVVNAKAWQPLVVIATPKDGDAFTLHIRHKGGPLLLKGVVDGKQKQFKEVWAKPESWAWSKVTGVKREQLGEQLFIIRGGGEGEIAVDAVVYEPVQPAKAQANDGPVLPEDATKQAESKILPPESPRANAQPTEARVTIAWDQPAGNIPAMIWGINDYEIHQPQNAADPEFNAFLTQLNPPIIRIHRGSFPKEWLDAEQKHFDVEKIKAAFAGATGYGDTPIMLNMSSWPKWMCEPGTGFLAAEHEDAWVAMCVELVRIMRDDVKRRVEYWEVTNERDGLYGKANRLDDLWRIYNKAVTAMRKVDPTAKFGGPAFTWANPQWVEPFVNNCLANTDFITYHNYGTGDIHDPNEKLFSKLNSIEGHARYIRKTIDAAAGGRHIPIHLSEYNVKWTWDPFERRHANAVGSVFHAGLIRRIALAGIDGAQHWHLKGNAYGLIDSNDEPRLTSHLYLWGRNELVGTIAKHDATPSDTLELLPVIRPDGSRALLIANRADGPVVIPAASELLGSTDLLIRQVTHTGATEPAPPARPAKRHLRVP
jgi:hypothetical protein